MIRQAKKMVQDRKFLKSKLSPTGNLKRISYILIILSYI